MTNRCSNARMTETADSNIRSFEFDSSFVIRHSSFEFRICDYAPRAAQTHLPPLQSLPARLGAWHGHRARGRLSRAGRVRDGVVAGVDVLRRVSSAAGRSGEDARVVSD